MDELTKAVAPYLHSSGGMPGGSATPPGPIGETFLIPLEAETQEGPSISYQYQKNSKKKELYCKLRNSAP